MTLVILYPFSIRYVCKLESWAHILRAFGLALKPGVTDTIEGLRCHTRFCKQNQVLIVCAPRIIYSTHTDIKCSQIAKYHE
jgi:hypothetical protein